MWLVYAVAAGLCWGTYVPFVQQAIRDLERNAFGSFLCVGVAYFLIAVLFPLTLFFGGAAPWPRWNASGITFATLAGVAGALGALCVIYAQRSARAVPGVNYSLYIAPIIFALAPVLNTVISLLWHPADGVFTFGIKHAPNWKFFVGILLTGAGAALVLYSKEESEAAPRPPAPAAAPQETAQRGTTP
jgi:drug/metabolite transporter (DMT)-like permease